MHGIEHQRKDNSPEYGLEEGQEHQKSQRSKKARHRQKKVCEDFLPHETKLYAMEGCPRCGAVLEIIECCGGGIFRCDRCGEYYFYGELIEFQRDSEGVSLKALERSQEEENPPPPPCRPHRI